MKPTIKKSFIFNGIFVISIGLVALLKGPIDFRGFPINNSVGIIIIAFGVLYVLSGIKRRALEDNPNDKPED